MWQYALKVVITAVVVVAVTELGKRSSLLAAALASLPLTSLLAFAWLHVDGAKQEQIAQLSTGIFWLVLPSLVLFLALPALLRHGFSFWTSLGVACAATVMAYAGMMIGLSRFGIRI